MRLRTTLGALLLVTACSSGSPSGTIVTPTPEPSVLDAGKSDVVLPAGTYYSPLDFVPPLAIKVPAGWTSAHRGDDAFDLGTDGVVVVFVTPDGETVAPALGALRAKAPHPVAATGTLDGQPATGFDATGGSGSFLVSPARTIELDLQPEQRIRVLGTDVDGTPLLAVVLVPDGTQWSTALPKALDLLAGVTPG